MKKLNILISLLVSFTCLARASSPLNLNDIFPEDNEITGWIRAEIPGLYEGDGLFDLIDGGADLYYEYGFNSVISGQLTDQKKNIIQVEIYKMADDSAAYGIFTFNRPKSRVQGNIGDGSVIADDYISFWKERYYVNISWLSSQDEMGAAMMDFARLVDSKITEKGSRPAMADRLRDIPLVNDIVFFNGNIALSNIYYFDYKDIFHIWQGYSFQYGTHWFLLFHYLSSEQASGIFTGLRSGIGNLKRFSSVEMQYQGMQFKDNKGRIVTFRLKGNDIVALISNEKDKDCQSIIEEFITKFY